MLSIGYSACHWCHVMERESFENEEVAELMNRHFVCIKVDREERPDIDQVYMSAVQLMTENSAGQFDPHLLQAFLRCASQLDLIFRELPDRGGR